MKVSSEHIAKKKKEYYERTRDVWKQYRLDHKEESTDRHRLRRQTDVNYRLACNLRTRLNAAFKRGWKTGSAIKDLGCSIEDFKIHITSLFKDGMNWDNYGEWQIDHIKPLSKFDLNDPNQLKIACHFTNLQPLWWQDNKMKGAN